MTWLRSKYRSSSLLSSKLQDQANEKVASSRTPDQQNLRPQCNAWQFSDRSQSVVVLGW
jgi:hypothetical protein